VNEALVFYDRLRAAGLRLDAFIVNRVLPHPQLTAPALRAELEPQPRLARLGPVERDAAFAALDTAVDYLARASQSQARELERLRSRAPETAVALLPLLAHEASSLTALRAIGNELDGSAKAPAAQRSASGT
jgi:hypothetical protein